MTPAPQRAQRVRGIPGVGLRTPDGREWLRWGRGFRHDPDNCDPVLSPHWVIARCAHPGGGEPCNHDTGLRWTACDECCRIADPFTVRYCGRPTVWGNPFGLVRTPNGGGGGCNWGVRRKTRGNWACTHVTHETALGIAARLFAERVIGKQPATYFDGLIGYDFLSCFCPLDQPCHVDAIIREGVARGIWTA